MREYVLGILEAYIEAQIAAWRRKLYRVRKMKLPMFTAADDKRVNTLLLHSRYDELYVVLESMEKRDFSALTVMELRKEAALVDIKNYQSLNKSQLVSLLTEYYNGYLHHSSNS
jgi:hypothetical protein